VILYPKQWQFVQTSPVPTFKLASADASGTFLSYAAAGNPAGLRRFAQAGIQTSEQLALDFIVTCTGAHTAM
jgi:hypothetical protein